MKKTKLFSTLTIYFLAMGILFLCALLGGVLVHTSNPEMFFGGNPDAFSAYCFICGVGSVPFLGIAAYLIYSHQKWRKGESLRDTGIRKDMVVVDLEVDHSSAGNSTLFGWVVCQEPDAHDRRRVGHDLWFTAENPVTGKKETFHHWTGDPRIRKERVESGVVDIYVDPEKPKDTFMNVSSCVLKLKG